MVFLIMVFVKVYVGNFKNKFCKNKKYYNMSKICFYVQFIIFYIFIRFYKNLKQDYSIK